MSALDSEIQAGASESRAIDPKRGIEGLYATGHWLLSESNPADAASVFRAMALLAPEDERSWLGLGACHEALGQPDLALKMYGTGRVLARPTVRCDIARARVLYAVGRDDEAQAALEQAAEVAEALDDETLIELVRLERRVS
jgi:tetratricopeptide (TPR) repeat protein